MAAWPSKDGSEDRSAWADWSTPLEQPKVIPLYQTLSETFRAHADLASLATNQLFLGLNPVTGAPETMDMARPRSFVIDDSHYAGPSILQTMTKAIKCRANQQHLPITIISHDNSGWYQLFKQYKNVNIVSPHSSSSEIRQLPYNTRNIPHFLVLDNLKDLLVSDHYDKSVLQFLISSGAESSGVYVLASCGQISNIKSQNEIDRWLKNDNLLRAKTSSLNKNKITLADGAHIWVPDPV